MKDLVRKDMTAKGLKNKNMKSKDIDMKQYDISQKCLNSPEKAQKVHGVFQNIALSYDSANERISLGLQQGWKKMLTERICQQIPTAAPILDVCCGTGDIALTIAQSRRDLPVTGLDFSEAMLEVARAKRDQANLSQILFIEGDAMDLPFPDDTFAAVTISFGLRNTSDYMQVIKEMKRVVKPGGCIYCLDSFVPEWRWIRPFYRIYFNKIMPLLGGGYKYQQEYKWLSESTEHFLQPKELMKMFQNAGLSRIRRKQKMFGACVLIWGRKERETGGKS